MKENNTTNLYEILKKEKIRVEKNEYNVLQYGFIDLSNIKSPNDFVSETCEIKDMKKDYSFVKTTYTVYKNGKHLFNKDLSEDELISFFEEKLSNVTK